MGLEGKIGFPEEEEEEAGWDDGNIMCGYIISHNFPSYFLLKGEKGKSPPSRNIFWSSKLTCHQQTGLEKKRKKVPSWLLVFLERNAEKILRFPVVSPSVPQLYRFGKRKPHIPRAARAGSYFPCHIWRVYTRKEGSCGDVISLATIPPLYSCCCCCCLFGQKELSACHRWKAKRKARCKSSHRPSRLEKKTVAEMYFTKKKDEEKKKEVFNTLEVNGATCQCVKVRQSANMLARSSSLSPAAAAATQRPASPSRDPPRLVRASQWQKIRSRNRLTTYRTLSLSLRPSPKCVTTTSNSSLFDWKLFLRQSYFLWTGAVALLLSTTEGPNSGASPKNRATKDFVFAPKRNYRIRLFIFPRPTYWVSFWRRWKETKKKSRRYFFGECQIANAWYLSLYGAGDYIKYIGGGIGSNFLCCSFSFSLPFLFVFGWQQQMLFLYVSCL